MEGLSLFKIVEHFLDGHGADAGSDGRRYKLLASFGGTLATKLVVELIELVHGQFTPVNDRSAPHRRRQFGVQRVAQDVVQRATAIWLSHHNQF